MAIRTGKSDRQHDYQWDDIADTICAMSIEDLATQLIAALPELANDVKIVLEKCLQEVEEEEGAVGKMYCKDCHACDTLDKWLKLKSLR